MLRKILTAAIFAGVISGLGITLVQEFTTTPLILRAEVYENTAWSREPTRFRPASLVLAHAGETHDPATASDWHPAGRLDRLLATLLSNIVTAVGFGLILVACYSLYGRKVNGRQGVIWGMAGFTIITLAPALGLPPELPGTIAADLSDRQIWWFAAVGSTATGLWLMVFRPGWMFSLLGIAALALPHLVGAPHPESIGGAVPPELASHFVAASLVTSAIFWAMLGWLSATLYDRENTAS